MNIRNGMCGLLGTVWAASLVAVAGCSSEVGADSKLGSQVWRSDGGKDAAPAPHEAAPPTKDVRDSAAPHPGDAAPSGPDSASKPDAGVSSDARSDTGPLPEQCPIEGNGCPSGCTAISGYRIDLDHSCRTADPLVACSRRSIFGDAVTCRVRISDGAVYYFTQQVLGPPYYEGWRACTTSERQAANGATSACP